MNIEILKKRAQIISQIRQFFDRKGILEVETPLMTHATGTDPYIESFSWVHPKHGSLYLQTSPEFAMKRLLAASSGSIYQICKAFRGDEVGRHHNSEFTILEWYHVDYDHHQLMDEMDELLQLILHTPQAQRFSYQKLFQHYLGIDPFSADVTVLKTYAQKNGLESIQGYKNADKDSWLQLLLNHFIEPKIGQDAPTFIYDYPPSQAALAKIRQDHPTVAERFEAYVKGIELANGFHELADAKEQRRRFEKEQEIRRQLGYPLVNIDERFLAALEKGFPDCAGVALGIDRLIMLALNQSHIENVVSFTFDNI